MRNRRRMKTTVQSHNKKCLVVLSFETVQPADHSTSLLVYVCNYNELMQIYIFEDYL